MTATETSTVQPQYAIVPTQSTALTATGPGQFTTQLHPYVQPMPPHMYYTPSPAPGAPANETLISVSDIIRWLRTYWKCGILIAMPIAALTFYFMGFSKKVYEGEAMLQVQIQDNTWLRMSKEGNGITELSAPQLVNNHRTGLKTRRFTDFLFNKINPTQMQSLLGPVGELGWKTKLLVALGVKSVPKTLPPEELFSKLVNEFVRIEPVKESHVLRVVVSGGDPELVASLANHYVNDYIEYVGNDSTEGARSALLQLTTKVVEAKTRLDDTEKELAEFNQKSDLLKSGDATDLNTLRADNLEKARSGVEVELLRSQERVQQLKLVLKEGRDPAGIKGLGDDSQIIEIQRKLIEAKSKYDALLEWCAPRHPKLLRAADEIVHMQSEAKSRIATIIEATESDEVRLMSEQERLKQMLADARSKAFGQSDARIRQKQLQDKVESQRLIFTELTQHQDRARLESELRNDSSLTVKDVAVPPEDPISPKKSLALAAAMMLMGLISVGVPLASGIVHDHFMPLLRTDAKQPTAPLMHAQPSPFQPPPPQPDPAPYPSGYELPQPSMRTENAGIVAEIPELMAGEGPVQLSELLHPNPLSGGNSISPITALLERQRSHTAGTRVLLLTSAKVSEGKSMICSALAASLCAMGRSVFLMECNPAAPSIQNWFPQADAHSSWTNDLETLRYGYSNLFLLPAHDLPSYDMADLLDGYRAWVQRAQAQGIDWVILDGASLLHGFADVAQLAPAATDVLFVHDPSCCDTEQVKAAINLLRPIVSHNSLRGMVLNRQTAHLG